MSGELALDLGEGNRWLVGVGLDRFPQDSRQAPIFDELGHPQEVFLGQHYEPLACFVSPELGAELDHSCLLSFVPADRWTIRCTTSREPSGWKSTRQSPT